MENEQTAHYADIFAALGAEPRLEIMRLLLGVHPDSLTVGDLQSRLQIPNSTLSHHLEKLRVEGLVSSRRDRQFLLYSANAGTVEALLSFLYNGCAVGDRAMPSEDPYQALELRENSPKKEGFMFQRFLRSIENLFGDWFGYVALPSGFDRFTQSSMQVIFLAQKESQRLEHRYVGTEQILLALIQEGTGIAAQVLAAVVNVDAVQRQIERYIGHGSGTPTEVPFTPRARDLLRIATEQAQQLGHDYIGTEHLLLGLLREGQGLGVKVLEDLGINLRSLEEQVRRAIG